MSFQVILLGSSIVQLTCTRGEGGAGVRVMVGMVRVAVDILYERVVRVVMTAAAANSITGEGQDNRVGLSHIIHTHTVIPPPHLTLSHRTRC